MEHKTHENHSDQHIIDILNDNDSSSGSSLDEGNYHSPRSSLDEGSYYSTRSSTDEERQCGCGIWNSMELVVTVVQIVAAIVVLTLAKNEHPQALLLTWLIGYTCGCIATLLILSLRFRKYNQVGEHSRTRMDKVKIGIDCFFVMWLVPGIVWICDDHSSPSDAPKLYRLCVDFFAFSCIRYAYPVLLCSIRLLEMCLFLMFCDCFVTPVVDRLDTLRSNVVDSVRDRLGVGSLVPIPNHDDCCCICLGEYGEGRIRRLECSHVFHSKCIDSWLKIKPACPLCQSQIAAAFVVLIQPKDEEHPQTLLFIWIICYTCVCIASLPTLCWRFWYYKRSVVSESTEESSGVTRINEVMDTLKFALECFFVSWFVVFLWNFMSNSSSLDDIY